MGGGRLDFIMTNLVKSLYPECVLLSLVNLWDVIMNQEV